MPSSIPGSPGADNISAFIQTLLDDGSAAAARATLLIPGRELDYVERTSALTITATSSATAQDFITCNAITVDGTQRIRIEVNTGYLATAGTIVVNLQEGSTVLGFMTEFAGAASVQTLVRYLTPSNGSHTYKITMWKTTGSSSANPGAGGAGTDMPAFVRITTA